MTETYYEANGFYEPNWFYMYLSKFDSIDLDFSKCTAVQKGLYIHEYTHYLQNIISISGVRNATNYYRFLNELRIKLGSLDKVELPILHSLFSDRTIANKLRFDTLKGVSFFDDSRSYDRFDTLIHVQNVNEKNERLLRVNFYQGYESIGYINYGNLCVKEGMSTALQSIYDTTLKQPFYPYQVTQLLVDQYCPIISDKPVHIAVLSSLALNFENSGYHFFRLLGEYREVASEISIKEFVKSELYDKKIEVNGKPGHSLKDILINSIKELKGVLENFLSSDLTYVKDLLHNLEALETNYELVFYEIFNATNLSDIEKLEELKAIYGVPLIQLDDGTLIFPSAETKSGVAEELIELMSIKTLAERLFEKDGNTVCRYFPFCNNDQNVVTDENCFDKQWKRTEECPFIQVANYWNITSKLPE